MRKGERARLVERSDGRVADGANGKDAKGRAEELRETTDAVGASSLLAAPPPGIPGRSQERPRVPRVFKLACSSDTAHSAV